MAVLHPSYDKSSSEIKDYDCVRDLTPYLPPDAEVTTVFIDKASSMRQIRAIEADVFVNLCGELFALFSSC